MLRKKTLLVLTLIMLLPGLNVYSQGFGVASGLKILGQLILLVSIFIAMIFVTLYGTKLVAKNAGTMVKSKYIQLLDAINIPGGSKIVIAKINNKIYLLTIDSNGSNLIDCIEEEDFLMIEDEFDNYFEKGTILGKLNDSKINKKIQSFYSNHINNTIKNKEDKNYEKED